MNIMQNTFNNNEEAYDANLGALERSTLNLNMTTGELDDLAGVIYAEASNRPTWAETGGIYGVLKNRANADGNSVFDQANAPGVYGAAHKDKIFDSHASQDKVNAVYRGIAVSIVSGKDFSGGGFYWQGNDFYRRVNWSKAYERFYLTGFQFTNSAHDIWGIGNHASGLKAYNYKYQSTAAYGETTFMKLTSEWMKAKGSNHWSGISIKIK